MREMKEIKDVTFKEVTSRLAHENSASGNQQRSHSFDWCANQVNGLQQRGGHWKLVEVSTDDMLGIKVETGHNHSLPGSPPLIQPGQTIREAVERLRTLDPKTMPVCWENISHQKNRDLLLTHLILKREGGQLWHVDGIHRTLAWIVYNKDGVMPAFVWEAFR